MSIKRIAVYPGTFDPPTNGHIDIARRASRMFDHVIIAVSTNSTKKPLFNLEERVHMLEQLFQDDATISVQGFDGLLVRFVQKVGAMAIVRGLRAVSDFEYELQLASMNAALDDAIETVFFMASDQNLFVSSSMIKEIVQLGGDISQKVHPVVMEQLRKKFLNK